MPRIPTWAVGVTTVVLAVLGGSAAQAADAGETLLPSTTRAFLAIPDVPALVEQWNKTQLGQLVKDPAMKPFIDDLRRQFEERSGAAHDRLGLTLDDLRDVAGGEVAVGLVQLPADQEAVAIVADVTGNREKAQALLQKISAALKKQGASESQTQLAGSPVVVFKLPPRERVEAAKVGEVPKAPQAVESRYAAYCLKDDFLCGSDSLDVLQGILIRRGGNAKNALAETAAYQAVMKRVKSDAGDDAALLRWFVHPTGYFEIVRAERAKAGRKGRAMLDVFKAEGFSAIQGIGGTVGLAVDRYELLHRTAVFAPGPYQGAMQMLKFPGASDFAPQPWVPAQAASYCTVYVDVLNAFDHFGSLFDALFNEGKPGLWEEVLTGLKKDEYGPQIDLRNELVSQLGNRVSVVTDYQLPITTTSERLLFAIEAKNEKAVARGLSKLFKNDREMRRRVHGDHEIWEAVPEEKAPVPVVQLELPGFGSEKPHAPAPGESKGAALLPNQAITAAYGQLFVASHYEYLVKILDKAKENEGRSTLARSIEYQVVSRAIKKVAPSQHIAENFAKTDEQYRPVYELLREGKMPESESMLGRILNTLFGAAKTGELRKPAIEGAKMPDFDIVRRSLGPAGLYATSDEQGWFLKGFLLPKGK